MSVPSLLNAAGRRRSPVTLHRYLAGRPPRNKGLRYPPDPPTVEEIVAVMRQRRPHAGLHRAALARRAAHQRRRSPSPSTASTRGPLRCSSATARAPAGARAAWIRGAGTTSVRGSNRACACPSDRFVRDRRPNPWPAVGARLSPRPNAARRRQGRRAAAVRAPPAAPRPRRRTRPRERPAQRHPAPIGAHQPRRHLHLPARNRQRRDHRQRPRPQGADDPRQHRTPHLSQPGPTGAPKLLASRRSTPGVRATPSPSRFGSPSGLSVISPSSTW
jgi:hypothetical protein